MKSQRILLWPLVVAVLLMLAPALFAQSAGTGALTGTVSDPSAAVVPNVTVTLTNNDTGQIRTATTGADGAYRFSLIQPGTYKVRFTATGFKVMVENPTDPTGLRVLKKCRVSVRRHFCHPTSFQGRGCENGRSTEDPASGS